MAVTEQRSSAAKGVTAPYPSRQQSAEASKSSSLRDNASSTKRKARFTPLASIKTFGGKSATEYGRDVEKAAAADKPAESYAPSPSSNSPPNGPPSSDAQATSPGAPHDEDAGAKGGPPGDYKERSRARILLIMLALGMAVFLAALDITIITTALPTIAAYFQSSAGYTWIGSAYLLATAASTPIWGKVSDIFGRKPVLLIANVFFFVGSLIAALSINIGMLIASRAIQGIGAGGLITLVNITIGDLFSPRRRGGYYGMIGGVWAIASSVGPVVGGAFTEKVSWRWCFYINLPLDGIAFVIILFFLDLQTPRTPIWAGLKSIDWLGAFLIVGGTLLLLFGLEYGGVTFPWKSATVLCLVIIGGILMISFFFAERFIAKNPIIPSRIFYKSTNIASLAACFLHSFVFISGSYYLPFYFQSVKGATPLLSGVYLLATSGAISVGSIFTGVFIRKTGNFLAPIFLGFILMTVGYGLYIDFDANSNFAKIIPYQIIGGLGTGPLFQAPLIALQSAISPRDIGTATAAFGFTRNFASAISVVVGSAVFDNVIASKAGSLRAALPAPVAQALSGGDIGANTGIINTLPPDQAQIAKVAFSDSLRPAWILYTAVSGLGLVAACFIGSQKLSKQHTETKTGLEAEKEAQAERKEEDRLRKERRVSRSQGGPRPESAASVGNGSLAARSIYHLRSMSRERHSASRHGRPLSSQSLETIATVGGNEEVQSSNIDSFTMERGPTDGKSGPAPMLEARSSDQHPVAGGAQNSSAANIASERLYSDLSADRTHSGLGSKNQ